MDCISSEYVTYGEQMTYQPAVGRVRQSSKTGRRISSLRYLLICGLVVLHLPPYVALDALPVSLSVFEFVPAFFTHGFFRATVPVLTCISGYLLFSSAAHYQYIKIVKTKAKTILLPLILWNLPFVVGLFFLRANNIWTPDVGMYKLYPFSAEEWLGAVLGIWDSPINYPLNFLRDLFALFLLSPVFLFLIRNAPLLGLVLVSLVFLFNFDGIIILRSAMAINFYVGGMIAFKRWNLNALDRYWVGLFVLALLMYAAAVYFRIENKVVLSLVAPFLIWPMSGWMVKTKMGQFFIHNSYHSFFIFLSHAFVLKAAYILYLRAPISIPYAAFWLLTPICTIAVCHLAHHLLRMFAPQLLNLLTGSRSKRGLTVQ